MPASLSTFADPSAPSPHPPPIFLDAPKQVEICFPPSWCVWRPPSSQLLCSSGRRSSDVSGGPQLGPVPVAAQTPPSLLMRGPDPVLQVHGADAALGEWVRNRNLTLSLQILTRRAFCSLLCVVELVGD